MIINTTLSIILIICIIIFLLGMFFGGLVFKTQYLPGLIVEICTELMVLYCAKLESFGVSKEILERAVQEVNDDI